MPKKRNLKDQKFGYLIAREDVGRDRTGNVKWACDCTGFLDDLSDCKRAHVVSAWSLTRGMSKSCGCFKSKKCGDARRKADGQAGFGRYRHGLLAAAKIRDHEFKLTDLQIYCLSQLPCVLCGERFSMVAKTSSTFRYADFKHNSIDQLVAGEGYVLGNVIPLCKAHNIMKLDHSLQDFLRLCLSALGISEHGNIADLVSRVERSAEKIAAWNETLFLDINIPTWIENV